MSDLQSAYHFVYQKVLELRVNSGGSDWSGVMSLWLPFLTQVPWNTPLFKCLRARAGLKLLSKSRGSYVSLKCWIGSKTMLSGHHCPQVGYLWFHTGSHATQPVAHIIDPRIHRRDEALYVGFPWKFSRFYAVSGGVMSSGSVCSFLLRMENFTFTPVFLAEHIVCGIHHCVPPKGITLSRGVWGKTL